MSMFNEETPGEHLMELFYGCGKNYRFCGSDEHTELEVWNIIYGVFTQDHPCTGMEYYGIEGLTNKTHKLDINNVHVREISEHVRLAVIDNNPWSACLSGTFIRFLDKLAPGQTRIYCKIVPEHVHHSPGKHQEQFFYTNNPLGRNTILKGFKAGAVILGLPNPQMFSPHSLRAYFVTSLANDSGVSDQERIADSRHSSVAAITIQYQRSE